MPQYKMIVICGYVLLHCIFVFSPSDVCVVIERIMRIYVTQRQRQSQRVIYCVLSCIYIFIYIVQECGGVR